MLLFLAPAFAADPPELLARLERTGFPETFAREAEQRGAGPRERQCVCDDVAPGILVCAVWSTPDALAYVTAEDLDTWGLTAPEAMARVRTSVRSGLSASRPALQTLPDGGGTYVVTQEADGRDAAALLHPDVMTERLGTAWVLAAPTSSTVLGWKLGDPELDKIVAIGVRRIFEAAGADALSPQIYSWKDGRWTVWGEAVPSSP